MANACIMQFEMTRADPAPNIDARTIAAHHAREACRLDAQSAEAWATLGFVLDRMGESLDARAALRRAVTLEPDNWRHHLRLAYVSWGEERLRAAHRALALLPDFPLAHWLAATVLVARQVLPEAEREIEAGLAAQAAGASRFNAVGLNWMLGLIRLARDDFAEALDQFERELSCETGNQLYARECAANTWYAIGALRLRQQRPADARRAFECALERIPIHPLAQVGFAAAGSPDRESQRDQGDQKGQASSATRTGSRVGPALAFEAVLGQAARLALTGNHAEAARIVDDLLTAAPPGNAAWLLPIEPLLHVAARPDCWARPLARLRNRAA
jgi:tetratricopeptide (TPR) repeat protein